MAFTVVLVTTYMALVSTSDFDLAFGSGAKDKPFLLLLIEVYASLMNTEQCGSLIN